MRICQPYGMQQRKGLYQYALVEPETWTRRKSCVRSQFWSIVCPDRIAGAYNTIIWLGKSMRSFYWNQLDFIQRNYRIIITAKSRSWLIIIEAYRIEVEDIPDVTKRKDWLKKRLWHDWKGIARALEKNDFFFEYATI